MTDTTHDNKLDRIRWITDELARINCGKVPGVTRSRGIAHPVFSKVYPARYLQAAVEY